MNGCVHEQANKQTIRYNQNTYRMGQIDIIAFQKEIIEIDNTANNEVYSLCEQILRV